MNIHFGRKVIQFVMWYRCKKKRNDDEKRTKHGCVMNCHFMKMLRSSAFTKFVTIGSKTVGREVESCHKVVDQREAAKIKSKNRTAGHENLG